MKGLLCGRTDSRFHVPASRLKDVPGPAWFQESEFLRIEVVAYGDRRELDFVDFLYESGTQFGRSAGIAD